jgi:peptide/nickel transport system permease protein
MRLGIKLVGGLIMIWVVASASFFLVHMMPGSPVAAAYQKLLQQPGETPTKAAAQVQSMYLFTPKQALPQQYLSYMDDLLHGNLGQSISETGVPVSHLITVALPWTVILVLSGTVVSFLIGTIAGVLAAIRRDSKLGSMLTVSGSLLHGIPQFVMAVLFIELFCTLWPIFPYGSPYDLEAVTEGWNLPFIWNLITHAFLPVMVYALSSYGGWLLGMRSSVISVLGDDFILAAELRGLKPSITARYVARNAMLPLFTILALSIGFMFSGSVFIEQLFVYPGLGETLLTSVTKEDYPLMEGAFLLITASVIAANIVADLLYTVIDPRIRRNV